jgi:hypothetical protein
MSSGETSTAQPGDDSGNGPVSVTGLDLPSVDLVLQDLPHISTSLPSRDTETIESDEQVQIVAALKGIIENSEGAAEAGSSFDLKELHASLEQADADAPRGRRTLENLQSVRTIIDRLWSCNSDYLAQAAEILANGSRDREF